ncbi:MAG: hemolysin III family protein [Chloroflexi bacterium]|nr:hemolysin III family protein [Chloroflexota bacterium]
MGTVRDIQSHHYTGDERPLFRGVMHGAIALLAPAGLVLLLLLADSPRGYVGAAVYAASVMLLYTTSASYHLAPWSDRLRRVMKRLDHSMIFILIAGTYTPFCLIVVGDAWGIPILSVVWTFAVLGVALKVLWPDSPRWLGVALYLALGWIGVVAVWPVVTNLSPAGIAMLAAGGGLYSIGALFYASRWPDPNPRLFGYHEVFHTLVVAGSVLHFIVVATYLL